MSILVGCGTEAPETEEESSQIVEIDAPDALPSRVFSNETSILMFSEEFQRHFRERLPQGVKRTELCGPYFVSADLEGDGAMDALAFMEVHDLGSGVKAAGVYLMLFEGIRVEIDDSKTQPTIQYDGGVGEGERVVIRISSIDLLEAGCLLDLDLPETTRAPYSSDGIVEIVPIELLEELEPRLRELGDVCGEYFIFMSPEENGERRIFFVTHVENEEGEGAGIMMFLPATIMVEIDETAIVPRVMLNVDEAGQERARVTLTSQEHKRSPCLPEPQQDILLPPPEEGEDASRS